MTATREEISRSLLECLNEVVSLLEHGKNVALKQQKALVDNDAEMIVLTARAQEEVLRRINESDQRAASLGSELLKAAGISDETADSDRIAAAAGHPYTDHIKREMDRVSELAEQMKSENDVCKALLRNGIEIIACCLRTLANDPGPNAYGPSASMSEPQAAVLSLDSRA